MPDEEPSSPASSLVALQSTVQEFWQRSGTAGRLLGGTVGGPPFRFTEGPPTANGNPHIGHLLARALKDTILRYRRMKGFQIVTPMAGWDCHGLPVELEIEKKHGLRSKKEIESYGVERFCEECRSGALEVVAIWQEMSGRLGYWLDYERPYRTMDPPFIESVWWALKELYTRGLLDRGHYSLPYCPRCETSLSSHEVAQGYRETTDPSVTVRLRVHLSTGEPDRYLLVWTTTPWTLPANLLVAARRDLPYVHVRAPDGAEYLLAESAKERYFPGDAGEVVRTLTGRDLEELRYTPPFPFAGPGEERYRVVLDDSVDPKEGTGLVHIAPSFGPEDLRIGQREGVGVLDPLDSRAVFGNTVPPVAGKSFKAADPILLQLLKESGVLFSASTVRHTYPFCWRCDTPLLYRALDSWFVRTSRFTDRLVRHNAGVNWLPPHLREGRFGNFLTEAKDWALSRSRYWGTPLPIWSCPGGHVRCVGSFAELRELAGSLPEPFDPHRVTVDRITFPCPECSATMRREPYTIDGWFDSGSAPFAQYHYPFEPGPFVPALPLDYVAEGLDQTRGWFYTMLVISTALFDRAAYANCVTSGLVLDERGLKMSKSKGNAIEPMDLLRRLGGDAARWAFYVLDYTEPVRISETAVRQSSQRTLGTLVNVLEFYRQNTVPGPAPTEPPPPTTLLDRWLLARLADLVERVGGALERYDHRTGALALQSFVADLSTWYLRRSRPRFWAEDATDDRRAASAALGYALVTLARLLAPYAPFTAEAVYQEAVGARFAEPAVSVHASGWPATRTTDGRLLESMDDLRRWVEVARELRQRAAVKSRIPLPSLVLRLPADAPLRALGDEGEALFRDELNVRELRWQDPTDSAAYAEADWVGTVAADGTGALLSRVPTPELLREGLVREALRRLQSARKEARLGYSEHIALELWAPEPLFGALASDRERLVREVLAVAPEIHPAPAPAEEGIQRWEFEGTEFAARIRRIPA
ncbi:MAG TPA: isoleucine--tRNA ligase [Thermoplasmata archaeon]|nr:isoleucine--tRNA ligase [Thermoplasmata archaeon]